MMDFRSRDFGVYYILIVLFVVQYIFAESEGKNKRRLEEERMNKINRTLSGNHIHTIIILLISAVLCLALLSGCSIVSVNKDSKTIGISLPTKSLERWNRDGIYLKEQFESQGYNVELRYSNDDVYQQNNDIECLIADGVDVLIVVPIDGDALSQTLKRAGEDGIEIISYDRLIRNTDAIDYYVSFDNNGVGRLQGQYIIDSLNLDKAEGTYNIEFVLGDPADNNATYYFNGAMEVLKPYLDSGKLNIPSGKESFEEAATPGWSTDDAYENMQNTLASYYSDGSRLDAVLASNDAVALGASKAIQSDYKGSNFPIITGQDADIITIHNIVDNTQAMTVFKNVNEEAAVAVEVAGALLEGRKPSDELIASLPKGTVFDTESYNNNARVVSSYLLPPAVITRANLDTLVATGHYKWDGEHKYLTSTK